MLIIDPDLPLHSLSQWCEAEHDPVQRALCPLSLWHQDILKAHGFALVKAPLHWEHAQRWHMTYVPERLEDMLTERSLLGTLHAPWGRKYTLLARGMLTSSPHVWSQHVRARELVALTRAHLLPDEPVRLLSHSSIFISAFSHAFPHSIVQIERPGQPSPGPASKSKRALPRLLKKFAMASARLLRLRRDADILITTHRQTDPIIAARTPSDPLLLDYRALTLAQRALSLGLSKLPTSWFRVTSHRSELDAALQTLEPGEQEMMGERLDVLERELRALLLDTTALHLLLDWLAPSLVITINWKGELPTMLRSWTGPKKVAFGVVQHGFQIGSIISPSTQRIDADIFYAWGASYVARWMDGAKNPHVDIQPHGNPLFEALTPCARKPSPGPKLRALFAPSGYFAHFCDDWQRLWEDFFSLVQSTSQTHQWSVRLHNQSQDIEHISAMLERLNIDSCSAHERPIAQDLGWADVVLTTVSSVVVDAIYSRTPVIVWNNIEQPEFFEDSIPVVCHLEQVVSALEALLPGSMQEHLASQERFLELFETQNITTAYWEDFNRRMGQG